MCKISVIIPVYNKQRYLNNLFNDLSAQSFGDYECLIVDDGSTDGSGELCDLAAKKDSRLKVFHIPNGGVSNARNYGMKRASGEYFTFVDSDDRLHPDFLANLLECMQKSGADMVIGNHRKIWQESSKDIDAIMPLKGLKKKSDILPMWGEAQKNTGIFGWCWAKLISRELALKSRFNTEIKLAEDLDYYLGIYPFVNTIYFDEKPYYYYLQSTENSSMLLADYDYDYFTQFKINLRLRDFFISQNVYGGENRAFVDERLSSYAFFTLFHSNFNKLGEYYKALKEIISLNELKLTGKNIRQKFFLLQFKMPDFIGIINLTLILLLYRTTRK